MSRFAQYAIRSSFVGTRTRGLPSVAHTWALVSRQDAQELGARKRLPEEFFKRSRSQTVAAAAVGNARSRLVIRPRIGARVRTHVPYRNLARPELWNALEPLSPDSPPLLAAPLFLAPLLGLFKTGAIAKAVTSAAAFLKSGAVVKVIGAISKVSFSIVASLRLMARRILRWWHGEEEIRRIRLKRREQGIPRKHRHFNRTITVLASVPLILIGLVFIASMERTPVWGRWRIILLSTDEEAMLVEEFLRAGTPKNSKVEENTPRDWLSILRCALGDDAGPPGTLGGLKILDPATDWRAAWVKDVFSRLQNGIHTLNLAVEHDKRRDEVRDVADTRYVVKPPEFPLSIRPSALKAQGVEEEAAVNGPLLTHYGLLVVDGPMCNAFSLGFGPARMLGNGKEEEAPGVVVVYTGILDGILQGKDYTPVPEPSSFAKAFGVFSGVNNTSAQSSGPTKNETDQLASILSHELGHLLLSHSLESIAAENTTDLIVGICTDLIRAALYPLTAILGPAFNDWFGEQVRANSALGLKVKSCCVSREAEFEADLLGLRILLGANIDPHIALDVWGPGGVFARWEAQQAALAAEEQDNGVGPPRQDADGWLDQSGFTQTHPPNAARYKRIEQELKSWMVPKEPPASDVPPTAP